MMKTRILFIVPALLLVLFTQCGKDNAFPEDTLIAEIENAQNKVNIEPSALPLAAQENIAEEYFESYIESVAYVSSKGYEVILGNEEQLYYRENGIRLRGGPNEFRRVRPCGRGIPVRVQELPAAITEYVAANYPDASILRAKQFPRAYVLLISGRRLLVFNDDLAFVAETRAFYFCDGIGHPVDIANLPASIPQYVSTNYPGAILAKAFFARGHIVIGLINGDSRVILVFDTAGNFLFVRD